MEYPTTFHDVITSTWERARAHLTTKQRRWGDAYLSLDQPSMAVVAKHLGISRAASCQLRKRLLTALWPYLRDYYQDKHLDENLERVALETHELILRKRAAYVEERPKGRFTIWEATSSPSDPVSKRIGLPEIIMGWRARPLRPNESPKDYPLMKWRRLKSSVLAQWWVRKAKEKGGSFSESLKVMLEAYHSRWPEGCSEERRYCAFCKSLLPLGETIEGAKVTIRRKYCSSRCKTYSKRYRKKS